MKKAIWICSAIAAVLAIVFVVFYFSGTRDAKPAPEATHTAIVPDLDPETLAATDPVMVSDSDLETFEISYAGLILKYPKKWQDQVIVQEQPDGSLLFSVDGSTLFYSVL